MITGNNFPAEKLANVTHVSAIVVRDPGGGREKVFHKYRTIRANSATLARFQRSMYILGDRLGQLIHINYYDKETHVFLYQWINDLP